MKKKIVYMTMLLISSLYGGKTKKRSTALPTNITMRVGDKLAVQGCTSKNSGIVQAEKSYIRAVTTGTVKVLQQSDRRKHTVTVTVVE